ncbi:MAG TPA: hypothetical protein VFF24_16060, partial [Acidimicrobiia bacterium]|nr:hypothetical protein [Acidimicrobiia bacterium]
MIEKPGPHPAGDSISPERANRNRSSVGTPLQMTVYVPPACIAAVIIMLFSVIRVTPAGAAEASAANFFAGRAGLSLVRVQVDTPGFLPIAGLVDLSFGRASVSISTNSDSIAEAGALHPGWAKSYQAVPSLLGLPVPSDALPEVPFIATAT